MLLDDSKLDDCEEAIWTQLLRIQKERLTTSSSHVLIGSVQYSTLSAKELQALAAVLENESTGLSKRVYKSPRAKNDLITNITSAVGVLSSDLFRAATTSSAVATPTAVAALSSSTTTGSGLHLSKWVPFGSKFLHLPKLQSTNVVSISGKGLSGQMSKVAFKNTKVSSDLKDILIKLIHKNKLPDLSELSAEDKKYLFDILSLTTSQDSMARMNLELSQKQNERMIASKQASSDVTKRRNLVNRSKRLASRLNILMGECRAGNQHNPKIESEVTRILNTLVTSGVISLAQAMAAREELK